MYILNTPVSEIMWLMAIGVGCFGGVRRVLVCAIQISIAERRLYD